MIHIILSFTVSFLFLVSGMLGIVDYTNKKAKNIDDSWSYRVTLKNGQIYNIKYEKINKLIEESIK